TLRRRLKEKGFLANVDKHRQKLTVRRTLQGARRDVLHLATAATSILCATGPTGPATSNPQGIGPVSWAGQSDGNGQQAQQPARKTEVKEELGRLGRSDTGEQINPRDEMQARGIDNEEDDEEATPIPPPEAKLHFEDDHGRPCGPGEASRWCWSGGPQWYDATQ